MISPFHLACQHALSRSLSHLRSVSDRRKRWGVLFLNCVYWLFIDLGGGLWFLQVCSQPLAQLWCLLRTAHPQQAYWAEPDQSFWISVAEAPPPPLQMAATPNWPGFRLWTMWPTILAPDILAEEKRRLSVAAALAKRFIEECGYLASCDPGKVSPNTETLTSAVGGSDLTFSDSSDLCSFAFPPVSHQTTAWTQEQDDVLDGTNPTSFTISFIFVYDPFLKFSI